MTDNVVTFTGTTKADLPADKVLMGAVDFADPAIVVGLDPDGKLYIASSLGDMDRVIALLARAQTWLCNQADQEED